ncbi:hypothetical protein MUK42_09096 [Musa troglodytarum]|uniref:Uncharacterized protein n=1 Tax=Musa troglodytarum TaxID=320322 RepID=A0A9E7JAL9_9LILI|nr:hypothetical protein MUK42_09096 [Musa troglodytarum]
MGEIKPRANRNCDNRKNHNWIRNTDVTVRKNGKRNQHVTLARTRYLDENTKDQEKPEYSGEIHGGLAWIRFNIT